MPRTDIQSLKAPVTRRFAVQAVSAVLAAPALMGLEARPPIKTRRLNNVMIAVSDLNRSAAFYERLFGPPVRDGEAAIFRVGGGPHFIGLIPASGGEKPGYRSYGMTVENFDAAETLRTLTMLGISGAAITKRGDTEELFVPDADGIRIQLQHTAYGRGTGVRGDVLPPVPAPSTPPAFQLKTLNHVTLTLANGAREAAFYKTVFDLPVQTTQGNGTILKIGDGLDNVVVNPTANNPNAIPGVNHVCVTIENFDPNRVMGILVGLGFEPIENGIPALLKPMTCRVRLRQRANNGGGPTSPLGSAELYFNDPDNIPVQIQDVSYCGGSGWLGQICP